MGVPVLKVHSVELEHCRFNAVVLATGNAMPWLAWVDDKDLVHYRHESRLVLGHVVEKGRIGPKDMSADDLVVDGIPRCKTLGCNDRVSSDARCEPCTDFCAAHCPCPKE